MTATTQARTDWNAIETQAADAVALKPCPFCGNDGRNEDVYADLEVVRETDQWVHWFHVLCHAETCHARGPARRESAEAIEAWNTRPADAIAAISALPDGWRDMKDVPEQNDPLLLLAKRAGDPTIRRVCGWRYSNQWAIYGCGKSQDCLDIIQPIAWQPLPEGPIIRQDRAALDGT